MTELINKQNGNIFLYSFLMLILNFIFNSKQKQLLK